jgi:nucleotide-binding universal stress UspA family protein
MPTEGDERGVKEKTMIKKVLVGLDGSPLAEYALPYVETIAGAAKADVTLLRVLPERETPVPLEQEYRRMYPFRLGPPPSPPERDPSSPEAIRYDARAYVDMVARHLGERGVVSEPILVSGDAASEIVGEAQARQADLIILATHGRSGLGRWIYGSVAEAVLARSPVPLLLVRAWSPELTLIRAGKPAPILVPLDGSPFSEKALPLARDLARALDAEIHLVRIASSEGHAVPDQSAASPDGDAQGAAAYLDAKIERFRHEGVRVSRSVRIGHPAVRIVELAGHIEAGLIVMATHGRTGLAGTLVGSTALEVLHRGSLPVVFVRPSAG